MSSTTEAVLWMTVVPAELTSVADALAHHPEVAFVLCPDADALYDYLATRIGALAGITHIETAPLTTTLKRSGTLLPRR